MSFPLPKKYYLIVHDAIRKVLGTEADISAFVTSKKPFQCDMLVNATATDPDLAMKSNPINNSNIHNNSNTSGMKKNKKDENAYVREFAVGLQRYLGTCDVVVRHRRLDVVFLDREVLQIALGAPLRAINNLQSAEEINNEPSWVRRNRLRISLGYDEELFTNTCDFKINVAARMMEKWVFENHIEGDSISSNSSSMFPTEGNVQESIQEYEQQQEEREELPPVSYWQAHGYVLAREYHVDHHIAILGTIAHNFAKYYGEFPFDNPYCPGEDLNTLASVEKLCKAWKQLPLEDWKSEYELQLGMGPPLGP